MYVQVEKLKDNKAIAHIGSRNNSNRRRNFEFLGETNLHSAATLQRQILNRGKLLDSEYTTLTNDATGDVQKIGAHIEAAKDMINGLKNLKVMVGHHGDNDGHHYPNASFSTVEMAEVNKLKLQFPNATLVDISKGMTKEEIIKAIKEGNVFFTWCFSDKRISKIQKEYETARNKFLTENY